MRSHSLKTRALALCLLLILSGAAVVHASGQGEPQLDQVRKLMQQQDYSDALKLLVEIQRANPGLRDETSRLMAEIMAVSQSYNGLLAQMGSAIEAGDVQKIQALVPLLQHTDPNRSAGLITQAEAIAGFLRLMNDAQALLAAGKNADALSKYLLVFTDPRQAGFSLPEAEFEAAGYGEILVGTVRGSIASALSAASRGSRLQPDIAKVVPALKALVSQPVSAATLSQFDTITLPFVQEAQGEGSVRKAATALTAIRQTIAQASGKNGDDPYLRYVTWILLGRGKTPEGVAYALHRLWEDAARQAAEAASDSSSSAFESARARYSSGALSSADADFAGQSVRSAVAVKAASLALGGYRVGPTTGWSLPASESRGAHELLDRALLAQEMSDEAGAYRLLISYHVQVSALPVPTLSSAGPQELARLQSARLTLDASSSGAADQETAWTSRATRWDTRTDVSGAATAIAASARTVAGLFGSLIRSDLQPRDLQYALRIAQLFESTFPARLQGVRDQRARAEDLSDGTVNGAAPPSGTIAQKHPDQALPLLSSTGSTLDQLISDMAAEEQRLGAETSHVKSSPAYTALLEGGGGQPGLVALLQQARSERARIDTLAASATRQVDAAALSSREGDNDFTQAEAALTRRDPDGASSALELATAAYLRSLADAYTEHASSRTTTEADALNVKILNLQNSLSVASAQKEIVAINKLIVAKDFLGASDALDAAVREWNQSQVGSYPPFDLLRSTIQAAVELSQGREISRLDPKADVVNAFIKNAQDNLAAGKLTDAAQNVRDALAVAPNYGAAKVLQLMIKKQTDPAGFERDASAQIATYLKMGADKTNVEGQKTAYLALLDYSRLDPRFAAQTKGTIQELEYSLGLARRPATAQQIARSNALVQQAGVIQQQGTAEGYQQALDLLKQALQVNPDNTDAIRLDGIIRTRMGSTALAALSPADTATYNQAFSLFLSGAYQDAYDRVMQIWDDPRSPRNKTYGPLQRLKKRLEIQLNIS